MYRSFPDFKLGAKNLLEDSGSRLGRLVDPDFSGIAAAIRHGQKEAVELA